MGLTLRYDARYDDVTAMIEFWPEGIPEASLETGDLSIFGSNDEN